MFVISCVVYASKFKPIEAGVTSGVKPSPVNPSNLVIHREPRKPRESTTNAHDWVWLGRATIDTSNRNSAVVNRNQADMRIITNPLNMNYCEPDDTLVGATSFSNPTHIDLPSCAIRNQEASELSSNRSIDSNTYCRSNAVGRQSTNLDQCSDELQIWYEYLYKNKNFDVIRRKITFLYLKIGHKERSHTKRKGKNLKIFNFELIREKLIFCFHSESKYLITTK